MEAIYEFEVKDMPVTVSVDANGESVHIEGPKIWSAKIADQNTCRTSLIAFWSLSQRV